MSSKKGFASAKKEKHIEWSSKGGSARVPKGFATLSSEERTANAKAGANAMWKKRRERINDMNQGYR